MRIQGFCLYCFYMLSHVFATPQTIQSTLCGPIDYTVHGILQDRILEWITISFSRGSSQPRSPTLQADSLPAEPRREAQENWSEQSNHSPADLPDPGIELGSLALQVDSLPAELPEKLALFLRFFFLFSFADKARDFIGKERPGRQQQVKGTQENCSATSQVLW